jgi:hypothetical protein
MEKAAATDGDNKSAAPANSQRQPDATNRHETESSGKVASAPLDLKAAQQTIREAQVVAIRPESLSREELARIQTRLRGLGFIGVVDGVWSQKMQEAIRQFKIANHLRNPDLWDFEADEKLKSPAAIQVYKSFLGGWSEYPCRGPDLKRPPLIINSRRANSSEGGSCEFTQIDPDGENWRVRAFCTVGKTSWAANITFAVRGNQLTWTSERA